MKRNYKFIAVLSALILGMASFSACSGNNDNNNSTSSKSSDNSAVQSLSGDESQTIDESTASESQNSGESSETEESSEEASEETSQDESSTDKEQSSKKSNEFQNPSESSTSTGNEDFDTVFKDNKLDVALNNDMKSAVSTEDMVNTMSKYKNLWVAEAENANNKLQASSLSDDEKKSIQDEYDEWVGSLKSKEQEIINQEKEKNVDGSIYRVTAAEKIKDYCREYAMSLYEKLYQIDGSFELAYNE